MFDVNNEENFGGDISQEEGGTTEQFANVPSEETDEGNPIEGAEGDVSTKKIQSDEDNKIAAAARREAESQVKAEKQRQDKFAKKYGYETFDAMEKAQLEAEQAQERQEYIERTGIDPTEIDKRVQEQLKNNPDFQEMQKVKSERQFMTQIDSLVSDFPDLKDVVKSVQDIGKLPNSEEIIKLVDNRGLSISDAYYLANRKDIVSGKSASAIQAAINNYKSKDHMKPTAGAGSPPATIKVPPETMAMYKGWFPKWTEDQIKKHYSEQ